CVEPTLDTHVADSAQGDGRGVAIDVARKPHSSVPFGTDAGACTRAHRVVETRQRRVCRTAPARRYGRKLGRAVRTELQPQPGTIGFERPAQKIESALETSAARYAHGAKSKVQGEVRVDLYDGGDDARVARRRTDVIGSNRDGSGGRDAARQHDRRDQATFRSRRDRDTTECRSGRDHRPPSALCGGRPLTRRSSRALLCDFTISHVPPLPRTTIPSRPLPTACAPSRSLPSPSTIRPLRAFLSAAASTAALLLKIRIPFSPFSKLATPDKRPPFPRTWSPSRPFPLATTSSKTAPAMVTRAPSLRLSRRSSRLTRASATASVATSPTPKPVTMPWRGAGEPITSAPSLPPSATRMPMPTPLP